MTNLWTQEETSAYRPREHAIGLYAKSSLADATPEKRAEFLANYLGLTQADHDTFMRLAYDKGRHVALNLIEGIISSL